VDRYADAPGHQVAHRAHVVSMTDPQALRQVIEQEQPHVIVPEIEAIATSLLVELEAAGVARVTPTARAAQLTGTQQHDAGGQGGQWRAKDGTGNAGHGAGLEGKFESH